MKIVIATPLYPPEIGGPATFTKFFEEELAVRHIRYQTVPFGKVRRYPKIIRHIAYFFRVVFAASRDDIVLALDPVSVGFPALCAARVRGARFFLRAPGDYAWEQGVQRFGVTQMLDEFVLAKSIGFPLPLQALIAVERYVARHAERIQVQSRYFAGIVGAWGVAPEKISVVPNSIAAGLAVSREEARRKLKLKSDEKIIVSAGRFVPWKGFGALIDAAGKINERYPTARLYLAGDGPERVALQERVVRDGAKVTFTGVVPQERLALMLAAADVFVLNTGYEGFSHQVLEAFAAGVPVVTTYAGGNAEIVADDENALVVPFNNADAIAVAVERIFSDAKLAEHLTRAAHKKVREFSREREFGAALEALGLSASIQEQKPLRILMLSGDANALSTESGVHRRLRLQAAKTGWLEVLVRSSQQKEVLLGEQGIVRGFCGSKYSVARAMVRAVHNKHFDVVTAQDPFALGLLGWHIARGQDAKLQLQVHTDVFAPAYAVHSLPNRARVLYARFLLSRADCIRVVSERIKQSLSSCGLRAPVCVLPIFIDVEAIKKAVPTDFQRDYPQFSKILLVASRLEKEKNIAAVLKAMQKILKEFPAAGLFIAGDGSQKRALASLARDLGIEKNVVFLGHRTDVFSLYKGADAVLATTAPYEGYGASAVEALAAGTAVVSTDAGVARQAGATVAAPEKIAKATVQILRSKMRGELKLPLPSEKEWARQWYEGIARCGLAS